MVLSYHIAKSKNQMNNLFATYSPEQPHKILRDNFQVSQISISNIQHLGKLKLEHPIYLPTYLTYQGSTLCPTDSIPELIFLPAPKSKIKVQLLVSNIFRSSRHCLTKSDYHTQPLPSYKSLTVPKMPI